MNEGNAELIAIVNGNPAKTLDKVIDERGLDAKIGGLDTLRTLLNQKKTYLSTVQFWANDEIYYEFNNSQYVSSPSVDANILYKVKFNASGTIKVSAALRVSTNEYGSGSLDIMINGARVVSLYKNSRSFEIAATTISVEIGDVMTFDMSSPGSAVAYLQENSLMLLAKVVKLSETGLLEVVASD